MDFINAKGQELEEIIEKCVRGFHSYFTNVDWVKLHKSIEFSSPSSEDQLLISREPTTTFGRNSPKLSRIRNLPPELFKSFKGNESEANYQALKKIHESLLSDIKNLTSLNSLSGDEVREKLSGLISKYSSQEEKQDLKPPLRKTKNLLITDMDESLSNVQSMRSFRKRKLPKKVFQLLYLSFSKIQFISLLLDSRKRWIVSQRNHTSLS